MKLQATLAAACVACAACAGDAIVDALARPQQRSGSYPTVDNVYDYYHNRAVQKDLAADAAWAALKTPAEIKAHQKKLRDGMVAAIGGFPERCPLNVQVTGRVKRDGYVLEKILFESRPKHYVSAHLFLPDDPKFKAPYPGIVSPCGHSRSGKNAPWYQRPGVVGATHGFATLVYDPIDQGERLQNFPATNENWSTTIEHNRIGYRAMLLGWSTAQFRIWDGMRAIDVLQSRPEVDGAKIGVYGISGGGTLTSYIMALDDRVGAACPAGYLTSMRALCDHCGPQDAEQNIHGQLAFGLNHLGYVLMRAPSAVMMNCTHADFFPFTGSQETYAAARGTYAALGASGRLAFFDVPGPHHWYESEMQASVAWMRHQLLGASAPTPAELAAFKRLDVGFSYAKVDVATADLARPQRHFTETGKVTPNGYVMELPGARSTYDVVRDELARADKLRGGISPDAVRRVVGMRRAAELSAVVCDVVESDADGVKIRAATLVTPENLRIPTVAFLPPSAKGAPALVVSDADRAALAPKVKKLLAEGRAVMVAELRAFGETGRLRTGAPSYGFYGCKDEDEEVAMLCSWLGESLVAHRAEDLLLAADEFARIAGAKPQILAEGRTCVPAAHAFYCERGRFAGVSCERRPASWRELVADQNLAYRFANVVYGGLRVYDWVDLLK